MNIEKVNLAPSFGSLNIKKVAHQHRPFVRANLGELKDLGEQYDIVMKSVINSPSKCEGIEIIVKNLRKNLSFFSKFNRPAGYSYFYTEPHYNVKPTSVLEQTKNALENLRKKTLLKKIG